MSADDYSNTYYYNNHEREEYSEAATAQAWNEWNSEQRYLQNYARNTEQNYENRPPPNYPYHTNALNHPGHLNHTAHGNRFPSYHNANQRQFYRNRYQNPYHQYATNASSSYGWQRNQSYKRTRPDGNEVDHSKSTKKKKKPLSQNVPTKKDWSIEEAECALATEKAYNKKSKNALIIKFPDHELNKEIVSQFHPAIENVHFQQPCTPRFCFVTLQESADPEEIINSLNKQKFGEGFLTVEYKKDRDEDQVILADDIDPLTLYVGNLAQEVTKDDIVNMYPNNKRIDIGFAKKMKFTRYAFIGFRTAAESLEAFKKTHSKQMYSKSLIVRFRRLHGTIGMPGEAKPQNPPRNRDDVLETSTSANDVISSVDINIVETNDVADNTGVDISTDEIPTSSTAQIKQERSSSISSDDDRDYKSLYQEDMGDGFTWNHKPKVKKEPNVKKEFDASSNDSFNIQKVKSETSSDNVTVKPEPVDSDDELDISNLYQDNEEGEGEKEEEVDVFADMMDFDRIYESMMSHKHKISMLKQSNHIK
ncbi:hypothetical protein RN001_007652 [Aquatica leii]|uniref:RRM domain-containing protein n=1 Tax=Aquatica leii TaxID=1421715 RepID=A0AAN7PC06_9COLE|nr:hypothetical protein RN001_007652 [Aquatica leii]